MLLRRQFLAAAVLLPWMARLTRGGTVKPWNVAHRGGAQLNPENTMAAFNKAIELGCQAFELDIHFSADRDLVVIHDDSLERCSHCPGIVHEMTMAQLRAADPHLPSLRQALRAARNHCKVLVEIKHPSHAPRYSGIEAVLLNQLEEEQMLDQVVVISFERKSLKILRELNPQVQTGLLVGGATDLAVDLRELGINWIAPHFSQIKPEYVLQAHRLGLRVNTWTVNQESDMRSCIQAGCDSITSDRPDLLKELLLSQ